ncbi:MAG: galactokinase [Fimbriimonadales bacterium]
MLCVRAPGRVNLIGEHTDYNEGFVLPVAINREIHLHAQPRTDHRCHFYSETLDDQIEFDMEWLATQPAESLPQGWFRYVAGVASLLQQRAGRPLTGVDAVITGNLPMGSGLSSSAAIEGAVAVMWNQIDQLGLSALELALLCQQAEWHYAGVRCGVMDQFASMLGKAGHALLIDTRTHFTETVPLPDDWVIVVADTGKPRTLAGSEYNRRRAECEQAVSELRAILGDAVNSLRDVSPEQASLYLPLLSEPARRRARHVVSENARVLTFLDALRQADAPTVRHLMLASHASLRDDYEVSCDELDWMVSACLSAPGCIGARMTGAGFGGACIALVQKELTEPFMEHARATYCQRSDYAPQFLLCEAVDGAGTC